MDDNLFQLVTLGLLGVTLLVLLVTLLTLNKVSKRLEEGGGPTTDSQFHDEDRRGGELAPAPQRQDSTPEPAQTSAYPAAQSTPEGEAAAQAEPEEERAPARSEEPQPAAEPEPEVQHAAQADTAFADAPEEQPFEREGRWWFKRADELLVYDEQSGQWEPAPAGAATGSAAPATPQGDTGWQGASQPATTEQPAQDQGSFWKCPSCGAVNGSTASACRMCFTPKP